MYEKTIEIAGITVRINSLFDSVDCSGFLSDKIPDFSVTISPEDIVDEQTKSIAEFEYENIPYPGFTVYELENTAIYRKIAIKLPYYNAFVFHGSAVAVDKDAFIFTAKSGTGKTTHTNLWLKNINNSYVVNGDKPVIKITENGAFVCGTPWMGKENLGCNKIVKLKAICNINRSEKNRIEKTGFNDIMPVLLGQCFRPKGSAEMVKTLELIDKLSSRVEFYNIFCNMNDDAALTAYKKLCGNRKDNVKNT